MLTRVLIDGCKVLSSAATEAEVREMYAAAKEQGGLAVHGPEDRDPEAFLFHYEFIGPIEVRYKNRSFVLFGSPTELRFYTPEEFEVLREG